MIKWVDALPPQATRGRKSKYVKIVEQLRTRPGQWAEIDRMPATVKSQTNLRAKGDRIRRKNPDVQVAVRTIGEERVLFMRSVKEE